MLPPHLHPVKHPMSVDEQEFDCSVLNCIMLFSVFWKTPVSRMKTDLIPSNHTCLTGLMPRKPGFVSRVKRNVSEKK
jgi:hypothetical protein